MRRWKFTRSLNRPWERRRLAGTFLDPVQQLAGETPALPAGAANK